MIIKIKNFQSIEDVTLDLPEGAFTCLVGQSNIGKSAIRRAIECVLYNKSDSSYIRNGTKFCSVEIIFSEGTCIKWMRDEKSASYEINGESFSKLSKTVPQPILDLGFKEIEIAKDKLNVQVASQFDNIFLLNMTGSKVTDVFSNLGNLNKIINANKSCTSDLKSNKGRLSLRREDIVSLKSKIKNYNGLDEQRNKLSGIRANFEEIQKIKKQAATLSLLSKKLDKATRLYRILSPVKQMTLEHLDVDIPRIMQINKIVKNLDESQRKILNLSALKEIKGIELNIDLDKFYRTKELYSKYILATTLKKNYSTLQNINEIVLDLEQEPKIKNLKELLLKLNKSKVSLLSLRTKCTEAEERRRKLQEEETTLHTQIKVCPLCDKEF